MKLYHYTSTTHLPRILEADVITVTESNLSARVAHAGPDVVWLSQEDIAVAEQDGLAGSSVDKTAVRFTVEVSDAVPWRVWSRRRGITKAWANTLESGRRADTWFVVARPIPQSEWVAIDSSVGEPLQWDWGQH